MEVESVEFSLIDLVDDACFLQAEPASKKNLEIINICSPHLDGVFIGDSTKIDHILTNLLGNSIKFSENGKIIVRTSVLSVDSLEKPKRIVSLTVSDQGIGMPEEVLDKVFESFTQADASTTRKFGGTGLGLTLCREYAKLLGGDITITSTQNVGTTVSVTLPIEKRPDHTVLPSASQEQTKRALIIGNDADVAEMLSSHLEVIGYDVEKKQALTDDLTENLRTHRSAIIFTPDYFTCDDQSLDTLASSNTPVIHCRFAGHSIERTESGKFITLSLPVTIGQLKVALNSAMPSWQPTIETYNPPVDSATDAPRILIAEDIEVNQTIISEILRSFGADYRIAENGEVALNLFTDEYFDLVLMDCQMPVMDGHAAAKSIRSLEEGSGRSRTPIIALTAGGTANERQDCIQSGMDAILEKPFTSDDIKELINLYCAKKVSPEKAIKVTPETNRSSERDLIDIEVVEGLLNLQKETGSGLLKRIIEGFREQMAHQTARLFTALDARDREQIRTTAHAIKSMSANVGAKRVREIAKEIEEFGIHENFNELEEKSMALHDNFQDFCEAIEREFLQELEQHAEM
jgi:CheY-like chemotaxis protein